eukprot:PITA_36313
MMVESNFQSFQINVLVVLAEKDLPSNVQQVLERFVASTWWFEAALTRQAMNTIIIQFLDGNILSHFGCPQKIITDNFAAFRSKKMIEFCHKYNNVLGYSISYYPRGNGLEKYSNKSLVNIIKKMLQDNKKSWHKKLVHALWADRVSTKKSIGMSSFQLVYGIDALFPSSVGIPVMKLLQEAEVESNDMQ